MHDQPAQGRIPAIIDVGTFHQRFGSSDACAEHLKRIRWGIHLERYVCSDCGHRRGWWLSRRRLVECAACRRQTSVTSGTVFHGTRTPLWKWFWAVYQMAQDKKGIAALELAKQASISYVTAWLMLHKLRHAMMVRDEWNLLEGLVEIDKTYIGGERHRGNQAQQVPVAVALELTAAGKPRRTAMAAVRRVDLRSLRKFAALRIEAEATLRTDGWHAKSPAAQHGMNDHQPEAPAADPRPRFCWLKTFVGNLKRVIGGTYHSVSPKHLDGYLAEFVYRANRRWMETTLFDRLIQAALVTKTITYKELVTGPNHIPRGRVRGGVGGAG